MKPDILIYIFTFARDYPDGYVDARYTARLPAISPATQIVIGDSGISPEEIRSVFLPIYTQLLIKNGTEKEREREKSRATKGERERERETILAMMHRELNDTMRSPPETQVREYACAYAVKIIKSRGTTQGITSLVANGGLNPRRAHAQTQTRR